MKNEPMVIVDVEDGWKEARVGDRVVLRFKFPPLMTMVELLDFAEHLRKLAEARQYGPS